MDGQAQEQRKYDRPVLDFVHVAGVDFDKEVHLPHFTAASVTDADVENFITDLVDAPNKDIFLMNNLGLSACDCKLEIAVARLWVQDAAAVHWMIGQTFWAWAKKCAIEAAA